MSSVLIIDDQEGILKLVGHMYKDGGYEVHLATSGKMGLAAALEKKPDLIVLDVMMPGMSGIDVCRKLRANPLTAQIPVIMLSAKAQVDDKVEGFAAGADDYVGKPVARAELMARSRALLARASYGQRPLAQVTAFIGAKGGVGTSTLAINTAVSLIQQKQSVTLLEMRSTPGTIIHQLKLTPEQDLGRLLELDPDHLSAKRINRAVFNHESGLELLVAPQTAVSNPMSTAHMHEIVQTLSHRSHYLFLDIPAAAGDVVKQVLEEHVDQIIVVTEPEPLSMAATSLTLATLKSWGVYDNSYVVVMARTPSAMLMRREEIQQQLKISHGMVWTIVPPLPEGFQQATRLGKPFVTIKPDSLPTEAINKVATHIMKFNRTKTVTAT